MFKRIALLLAALLAVGSITSPAFAQDEEQSETTTETKPAGGGGEPGAGLWGEWLWAAGNATELAGARRTAQLQGGWRRGDSAG